MTYIDPALAVNSREYWEQYFGGLWDRNNGRGQTASFMCSLIENLPAPEKQYLSQRTSTVLDWGCAFGDGVALLSMAFPSCKVAGLDFAERAIEEARVRFPGSEFLHVPEGGGIGRQFDVIITSNCLEHFEDPLTVVESHLGWCRKFYVALVPYREVPLIDCHFAQFRDECFPPQMGQFTRVFAAPIDVDQMFWTGQQLLVVYASREYLEERDSAASDADRARESSRGSLSGYDGLDPTLAQVGAELAHELLAQLPSGSSVLEAGPSGLWPGLSLAKTGRLHVSVMDSLPSALQSAERDFRAQRLTANFVQGDPASPGEPEYDLVLNAGQLARLTFNDQVNLVRGMASRSRKYVLAVVPNARCYWYWLWRMHLSGRGQWSFGKEVPAVDLQAVFEAAGLKFVGQWIGGTQWTDSIVDRFPDLDDSLREHIHTLHQSGIVPRDQQGYLIAGLAVLPGVQVSSNWSAPTREPVLTPDALQAALVDALAQITAQEHRCRQLEHKLEERDALLARQAPEYNELKAMQHSLRVVRESCELVAPASTAASDGAFLDVLLGEREELIEDRQDLLHQNSLLRDRLAAIEGCRTWRLATKFQLARRIILPHQSIREHLVRGIWRTSKALPRSLARTTIRLGETHSPDWLFTRAKSMGRRVLPPSLWQRLKRLRGNTLPHAGSASSIETDVDRFLHWASEQPAGRIVAIVSGTTFTTSEGQRPTRLARELARRGVPVLFIYWRWNSNEPIPAQKCREVLEVPFDWFLARRDHLLSNSAIAQLSRALVIEFPHPSLVEIVNHANAQDWRTVYDVIDDWAEFHKAGQAVWFDAEAETYVARNVDAVTVTCPTLANIEPLSGLENVRLLPNAFEDWSGGTSVHAAAPATGGGLTIGYFGHLTNAWFDWDLIAATAQRHADWTFEIIGYGQDAKIALPKNVKLLGKIEHRELPRHAARWHAAMIPFRTMPLTAGVDPIKIYEYISLGLSTIVTGMPHLASYPGAYCAHDLPSFEQAILRAAEQRLDSQVVTEFLNQNRWANRVSALLEMVDQVPVGAVARAVVGVNRNRLAA